MAIEIRKRPYAYCFSGNPVHYELFSTLASIDPGMYVEVRVMFKTIGGAYVSTEALPYAPTSGICTIDVRSILEGLLEYSLPGVAQDEKTVWQATGQTGRFYLQWREVTTQNPSPSWDDSEAEHSCFVVYGGLAQFKYQGNNYWVNYYNPNRPFLTWQLSGRLAYPTERMYLLWLNIQNLSGKTVAVRCEAFAADGTTAAVSATISTPAEGAAYYVPAGASQWGVQSLPGGKRLHKWSIQVVDATEPSAPVALSQKFWYERDNRNNYTGVGHNYRNSLGGLDSYSIRGVLQTDVEYSFQEQRRTVQPNYFDGSAFDPQTIIVDSLEQLIWKGDIGHLGKEEQDRLRDVHLKREVWWWVDGKWWPVNLVTKSQTLRKSDQFRWSMPIEWTLALEGDRHYTPMAVPLGNGVFTDNVCLALPVDLFVEKLEMAGQIQVRVVFSVQDPQAAAQRIQWRVVGYYDWTFGVLNQAAQFLLPKEVQPLFEMQVLCTNDVPGKKVSLVISTVSAPAPPDPPPGGGTPPPAPVTVPFRFINNTSATMQAVLQKLDAGSWVYVTTQSLGANSMVVATISTIGATSLRVSFGAFSPSFVTLEVAGNTRYPDQVGSGWYQFDDVAINELAFASITVN